MKFLHLGLILVFFCFEAKASLTAKVILVRGEVTMLAPGKIKAQPVKKGDVLVEDTSVVTKAKSFVRLKFSDNSSMNVAPKSMAVISKMPKNKASVVKLLNGIVKAEVKKQAKKKTTTKMIVKTPNAVLGVRGTKFQSIYNPSNKTTSLVTVEGQVAMKKEATKPVSAIASPVDEVEALDESINSGSDVIEVPAGKYTGLNDSTAEPIEPVKIAPEQYNALAKSMGHNETAAEVMKVTADDEIKAAENSSIKSGGYVDFDTGLYVPPAANAKLDTQTGTYEAPKLGKIDESGDFIPPKGVKVDDKKGLVIDEKELATLASKEEQKQIKAAVFEVKKSEKKVPLVVNKVKAQKKAKPRKPWGPKNHILTAKFTPYFEGLRVKNRANGGTANVASENANNLIFTWRQVWSDEWSTRLRLGTMKYEFDDSDVNIRYYGEEDESNEFFSLGTLYQLDKKTILSLDLVDRQAFYVVSQSGSSSGEVQYRTQYLQTLDIGVRRMIKSYEKIAYYFTGNLEFGLDVSAPSQDREQSAEHSGLTLGLEAEWMYSKKLGIFPSVFYHSLETENDDFRFERTALGFGLDFVYDI